MNKNSYDFRFCDLISVSLAVTFFKEEGKVEEADKCEPITDHRLLITKGCIL